jgi:hypothetical protein
LGGLKTIHYGHVAVHKYEFVIGSFAIAVAWAICIFLCSFHNLFNGILTIKGFICLNFEAALYDGLQGNNIENIVINN